MATKKKRASVKRNKATKKSSARKKSPRRAAPTKKSFTSNVAELEFPHSMLLIPTARDGEAEESTFAMAAAGRSAFGAKLNYTPPAKSASSVLTDIGMDDFEKVQTRRGEASSHGVYSNLNSLGMATAFFGGESEVEEAQDKLQNDYDFVPNFSLTLPPKIQMEDVSANRGRAALDHSEWPEESGVAEAHARGIRGEGVLMGVLDTGVDADHVEFSHRTIQYRYVSIFPDSPYWPPRDVRGFDTDGHGSHVCGIIAGRNTGVAPEVNLYCASVIESESTRSSLLRVAHGLDWILRQFSRPDNEQLPGVLSMSLGFPTTTPDDISDGEFDQRVRVIRTMLRTLIQANVLPVIAIGNDGEGAINVPGAFKESLAVGAVDFSGKVADFSSSGRYERISKPDISGYGVGVYSSVERDYMNNSLYERFNGTSMATPYVAGIASLYRCQQPLLTVEETWEKIVDSAKTLRGQSRNRVGKGLARFVI